MNYTNSSPKPYNNSIDKLNQYVPNTATPMFKNSYNLPHFPVPELKQTIKKYLKSVIPLLNEEELKNTKKLLAQFSAEDGIGTKLQTLLLEKAQRCENWFADWWLNNAYLKRRDPVVVYTSPGLIFPFENFTDEGARLTYTARLILSVLQYQNAINNDKIPIDKAGKDILDMNQYKKIFGTCRVVGEKIDSLEFHPKSKHIVVVRNNIFFKLQIINSENKVPSLSQLVNQLESILLQSDKLGAPIGILTTEKRDNWYNAYMELIKDPLNRKSVEEIQRALFLVAIDNPMPELNLSRISMASRQFIHGGGSQGNSANRWFDKTVQFIIGQDGTVGLTFEHSPLDGLPIAAMGDYLVDYMKNHEVARLQDVNFEHLPEKLQFNISNDLEKYIQGATNHIDDLVSKVQVNLFNFSAFGKHFIKTQQLSPDSFIQMAIQYTFYRIYKVPRAHYEAGSIRKFIQGRTEAIRSCSEESVNFARAMLDIERTDAEKLAALQKAVTCHKKYAAEAVNGSGVDRHLLGLKLIALENGIEPPEIYEDCSYTRSTYFHILSSNVPTKCKVMTFCPYNINTYSCCYNLRSNDINFSVIAFTECPEVSASIFREALERSLLDMHDVLQKSNVM